MKRTASQKRQPTRKGIYAKRQDFKLLSKNNIFFQKMLTFQKVYAIIGIAHVKRAYNNGVPTFLDSSVGRAHDC